MDSYFAEVVHPPDLHGAVHGAGEEKGVGAVDLEPCDWSSVAVEHMYLSEHDCIPHLQHKSSLVTQQNKGITLGGVVTQQSKCITLGSVVTQQNKGITLGSVVTQQNKCITFR